MKKSFALRAADDLHWFAEKISMPPTSDLLFFSIYLFFFFLLNLFILSFQLIWKNLIESKAKLASIQQPRRGIDHPHGCFNPLRIESVAQIRGNWRLGSRLRSVTENSNPNTQHEMISSRARGMIATLMPPFFYRTTNIILRRCWKSYPAF